MIRDAKNNIIDEIRNLRTLICDIETAENEDKIAKLQKQLNKIQDKVFGI